VALTIVGVRHHSPACARLVAHTIERVRPRHVLIEGPVDMSARIDELALAHKLPIAIFSYRTQHEHTHSSWSPLCDYSPEWIALCKAREVGAKGAFMDLPAWHDAFTGVRNRYSDRKDRVGERMEALCARLGVEDTDALWDRLFEQPMPIEQLEERLRLYFIELRADEPASERDAPREEYMARWIAWAMADCKANGGDVVAVCGGFHAPVLEAQWRTVPSTLPDVPIVDESARIGSYLVPYSFHRLDSFVGYESGMPSPAFYQRLFEQGADTAGETMLFEAIQWLRKKKQRVSPADAIAASGLAHGLSRLRGHAALARVDVLDGIAGAVVKDALEAPLPWTRRGRILARTDPLVVELVASFSGERVGTLAPSTPRPPLVHDAFAMLEAEKIPFEAKPKALTLSMISEDDRRKSRVLHRLRVLGIPGFQRTRALSIKRGGADLSEAWSVHRHLDADASLIEASAYGASLESAASGKLEEQLATAQNLEALATFLYEAACCGIHHLTARVLADIRRTVDAEPSFEILGGALSRLLGLFRHDTLLGTAGSPELGAVISASFERGLWLFEGIDGETAPASAPQVRAVVALRDTLRECEERLSLDRPRAQAVMERRAIAHHAPPALRGGALGFLWSTGVDGAQAEQRALASLKAAATPTKFGDYLVGLFALAREEVMGTQSLLRAIDSVVTELDRQDFMIGVPSLRLAFSFFPPQEKERIAKGVLALHGKDEISAHEMVHALVDPKVTLAGLHLDAEIDALAKRYGLEEDA